MRRLFARLLSGSGAAALLRLALVRGGRFAVVFHGVTRAAHERIPAAARPCLDAEGLRRSLVWLGRHFEFLTPEAFLDGGTAGVLLTFDDGFANNVEVALPILRRWQAPAVFFVSARHVRDARDWLPPVRRQAAIGFPRPAELAAEVAHDLYDGMGLEGLRVCAADPLITVGSHTIDHPDLTTCGAAELRRELLRSKELLAEWTGAPVELFAYPFGRYDARVLAAVREAGYRAAFVEGSRRLGELRYELPRVGIYDSAPSYLAAKLSGLHLSPLRAPVAGSLAGRGDRR